MTEPRRPSLPDVRGFGGTDLDTNERHRSPELDPNVETVVFVDDGGNLVDADGRPVDEYGIPLEQPVIYVDDVGNLVDADGRPVDEYGRLLVTSAHPGPPAPNDDPVVVEEPPHRTELPDPPSPHQGRHAGPSTRETDTETGEYLALARESHPVNKLLIGLLVVGLLALVVGGGAYWWYQRQVNPPGGQGVALRVDLPEGSSTDDIGTILADEDVITNGTAFSFYVSREGKGDFQAGRYEFRENSSFDDAIRILEAGPIPAQVVRVTIPEGFTLDQIVERVSTQAPQIYREALETVITSGQVRSMYQPPNGAAMEGLLFPATYEIGPDDDATKVVQEMVTATDRTATELDIETGASSLSTRAGRPLTAYEVLTVASLVQSEAGNSAEMPRIAAVIYNRLRDGTPLGIDATTLYEANLNGTAADFESSSPFNTRRVPGLPPTPISAPGRDAIGAALRPSDEASTYYVLEAPGQHFFTDSPEEFEQAVQRCRERNLGCT